uniref:Cytochrome c6 n=1 Tax=Compsopogon caeruleus TaxID=31354 RepID=A0A1Z1XBE0_9RHOD|nr:cytochrome c553 [Compsopogon caeruleus]ARX96175.1 cytochrome c553 [Compsopogon caeruleus]
MDLYLINLNYPGDNVLKKISFILSTILITALVISSQISYAVNIEHGEQVFSANCSACHAGGNNAIMAEKTLKKEALATNDMNSISAITYQVTNGKNAMPAFGGRLTDDDIEDVANYVLSQSEKGW